MKDKALSHITANSQTSKTKDPAAPLKAENDKTFIRE